MALICQASTRPPSLPEFTFHQHPDQTPWHSPSTHVSVCTHPSSPPIAQWTYMAVDSAPNQRADTHTCLLHAPRRPPHCCACVCPPRHGNAAPPNGQ
jgi:hypothetical protein